MNREPLGMATAAVVAAVAVINVAVSLGWLDWTGEQVASVKTALEALAVLAGVFWARGKVTPVADPRDGEGNPLTAEVL